MVTTRVCLTLSQAGLGDPSSLLVNIYTCVGLFEALVEITRVMEQPYVLATSLRCGKVVIECVLKKIVPFLKTHFRSYKEQVMKIIQGLQSCTRRLQIVCAHGKVIKDRSLVGLVPTLRKEMEKFIYEVKGLLVAHNCSSAFKIGTLKHRSLQGDEVASQMIAETEIPSSTETEGDGEEE